MTEKEFHAKMGKICYKHYTFIQCDEVWFHHKISKLLKKYKNEKEKK